MRKIITTLFFTMALVCSTNVSAKYYNSGNSYNKFGNTTYGYNRNTGSNWRSSSSGSITRGVDKRGNSWSYNRSTGAYYNSNGTMRYGKGSNRRSYKSRY